MDPLTTAVMPERGEQHAELTSAWYIVGGLRMHVRVAGDGASPPVVLVHGLGVSSRYFLPTQMRLARDFHVFAPDLPGFGESESPRNVLTVSELADVLDDWLETLGVGPSALVGNSLGCQIIVDLALRRPQLLTCAVLNSPTIDPHARNMVRQFVRLLMDAPREYPGQNLVILRDYFACGPRRLIQTFRDSLNDPIQEKLPHVRVPVMIVRGARDPIVSQQWVEEAAALLPNGCLRVLPGAAHTANFSSPLQFTRVIRPFLAAHSPSAETAPLAPRSSDTLRRGLVSGPGM
jgi:2-hydroxy-6-oxonona-2,4-dienedioate hydrolase